jgi:hypothetical protein
VLQGLLVARIARCKDCSRCNDKALKVVRRLFEIGIIGGAAESPAACRLMMLDGDRSGAAFGTRWNVETTKRRSIGLR